MRRRVRDKERREALSEAGDGWRAKEKRWRPEIRAPEAQYHSIHTPSPAQLYGEQIKEQCDKNEAHGASLRGTLDARCCRREAVVRSYGPAGSSLHNVETFGMPGRNTGREDSDQ